MGRSKLPRDQVDATLLERRTRVAAMLARGLRDGEIARAMPEVSRKVVGDDIRWVEARWLEAVQRDVGLWKAESVARMKEVIRACWEEWERSRRDAELRSLKRRSPGGQANGGGKSAEESTATVRGSCGNPAYIGRMIEATQEIMKIVGGYAPQESRLVDDEGSDVLSKLIDRLDMDELRTLDGMFVKWEAAEAERRAATKALPKPDGDSGAE